MKDVQALPYPLWCAIAIVTAVAGAILLVRLLRWLDRPYVERRQTVENQINTAAASSESFRQELERTFSQMDRDIAGMFPAVPETDFDGIFARIEQQVNNGPRNRSIFTDNGGHTILFERNFPNSTFCCITIDNCIKIVDGPDEISMDIVNALRRGLVSCPVPVPGVLMMTMRQAIEVAEGKTTLCRLMGRPEATSSTQEPKPFKKTKHRRNFDSLTKEQS